ncbi:hypothetical protein EGW08_003722 [Elysia chlorotica]|uniref:Saposin B-type domain-containing protein n=1 Tax=Elysia chlorotica TaxID=188477 RepID=A0A433U3Z9_ELYCH|nr:hypothetical protein EGW08_003722 [Elysia chlorotica]
MSQSRPAVYLLVLLLELCCVPCVITNYRLSAKPFMDFMSDQNCWGALQKCENIHQKVIKKWNAIPKRRAKCVIDTCTSFRKKYEAAKKYVNLYMKLGILPGVCAADENLQDLLSSFPEHSYSSMGVQQPPMYLPVLLGAAVVARILP